MTQDTFDPEQARAWLDTLYGGTEGLISIVSTRNWTGQTCKDVDAAINYITQLDKGQPQGIYARATTLRDVPEGHSRGTNNDTHEYIGFWADLDISGPGHKHHVCDGVPCAQAEQDAADGRRHVANFLGLLPDEAACRELIERTGLPAPTEWVASGGGMYPWWLLVDPAETIDRIPEVSAASTQLQEIIAVTALDMGYHYGKGVGDNSRVLRIPGTVNRKPDCVPVTATWRMELSGSEPYTLNALLAAVAEIHARVVPPPPPRKPLVVKPTAAGTGLRVGDAFNAATTWQDLLEADGALISRQVGDYIEWLRPGKRRGDRISGTTSYGTGDSLHVFSDAWLPLEQGLTCDRFGYYVRTRHNGDFNAATKQLASEGFGDPLPARNEYTYTAPSILERAPATAASPDAPVPAAAAVTATPQATQVLTYTWTDSGLADRMQVRHGDEWRYIATREKKPWLRWDGSLWVTDTRGTVTNQVNTLAAEAYNEAADKYDAAELVDDAKEMKKLEKLLTSIRPALGNARQKGATEVFSRRPQIACVEKDLDATRERVTLLNGVINLDTYEFGPFDPAMLATKRMGVAYEAGAKAPRWEKFLAEVLPDPAMRDYLQRAAGYTLLGKPVRKAIFMLHSSKPNTGKSQVINALKEIFGDFGVGTKEQTFRINDSATAATPALHKLKGARLVTASEFNEGARLDEALIKQITGGGDAIESRGLYQDEESWLPDFSMWVASNHLPKFNADDAAIWKRVKPIHFPVVFGAEGGPQEVMDIGRTLVAEEGPGILNWLLEGARAYRERGLDEPEALTRGVAAYRQEADPVARFLAAAVDEGTVVEAPERTIEAKALYAWFQTWCQDEGIKHPLPANRFGMRLGSLGFQRTKDSTGRVRMWRGLGAGGSTWVASGYPLLT